jgi:hypothetical protein
MDFLRQPVDALHWKVMARLPVDADRILAFKAALFSRPRPR